MRSIHSYLVSGTDLLLLLVALIWGSNFAVVKQTLSEMLPLAFNALRFSLASLLLSAILLFSEGGFLLNKKDIKGILLLGIVGHTFYQLLFINGIARTTASLSALMMATNPVFVALIGLQARREKPSVRLLLGASLSLVGVYVLIYGSRSGFSLSETHVFGTVLVLLASLCWAAYTVFSKPYLTRYSPLRLTATSAVLGTIILDLVAIPSLFAQEWVRVSVAGWAGFGYSFGLAIVTAYVLWDIGIQRVGPGRTAIYENLTPVVAAFIAYLFLGEILTGFQIAGAALVFLGIYLTRKT